MRYGRDASRTHGAQLREERRAFKTEQASVLAESGLAETERKQTGETRRAQMKIEADRQAAERKATVDRQAVLAKEVAGGEGAMTADQMAKHKSGALKQSRESLETMRDFKGNVIHPATGEVMTGAQEAEFVKFEADNLLKYSLGETAPEAEGVAPQGRGWAETEGGRRFEIAPETREGFVETAQTARTPMAPVGVVPPGGVPAEATPSVVAPAPVVAQEPSPVQPAATRLREEYEAKQQAAMPKPLQAMTRGISKYLKGNILSRTSYSPGQRAAIGRTKTTAPLGLRGFMENRYGR